MEGSKHIQYTLTDSVSLKNIFVHFHGFSSLQWRKIARIFRIFGNACTLFICYSGVLKQMDPDGYSAFSNM